MEGILSIIQSLTNVDRKRLPLVIKSLDEHQAFSLKNVSELNVIVQQINDLLTDRQRKSEGLLLLSTVLAQCPIELLEQKGTFWMHTCAKICLQCSPIESVELAYRVLGDLLKKSTNTPDLSKSIDSNAMIKMIEPISNAPPAAYFSVMKFLEIAMLTYPTTCGASRTIIEKFIVAFVDSVDENLVTQSAKCLHLLQRVRNAGPHGQNYKQSWSQLQSQLLGSLHEYLSVIFRNAIDETSTISEGDHGSGNGERLRNLPELELSTDPVTRTMQLQIRFVNLCKYLRTVLLEPFPVAKSIQPMKIICLISRGLAVNCQTLSKKLITDNIVLGTFLPRIHVALLNLLDALILVLRGHMLLYGRGVCQLINQSLKWTASGKPTGFKRIFITLRKATYHTLDLWCRTASHGSGVETIADDLIQQILNDITPFENEVTLKVITSGAGGKKLSKKAQRKLLKQQNDSTNLARMYSNHLIMPGGKNTSIFSDGNEELCASALRCLVNILSSTGCFLKPATHKILQENIVAIAMAAIEWRRTTESRNFLYSSPDCRLELFSALHSLIVSSHYLCPPPVQYAVTIFNMAKLNDVSPKIRGICADFTRSLEKIMHPQVGCLYYPAEFDDIRMALRQQSADSDDNVDNENDVEIEMADLDEQKNVENQNTIIENDVEISSQIIEKPIDEAATESISSSPIEIVELDSSNSNQSEVPNKPDDLSKKNISSDCVEEILKSPPKNTATATKRHLTPEIVENLMDSNINIKDAPAPAHSSSNDDNDKVPSPKKMCRNFETINEETDNKNTAKESPTDDADIVDELASSFVYELTENIST